MMNFIAETGKRTTDMAWLRFSKELAINTENIAYMTDRSDLPFKDCTDIFFVDGKHLELEGISVDEMLDMINDSERKHK